MDAGEAKPDGSEVSGEASVVRDCIKLKERDEKGQGD